LKSPPNDATNFSSVLSKGHNVSRERKKKERKKKKAVILTYCQFRQIRFELIFCPKIFRISLPPLLPNYSKR
jgi:hypothetical protein